jgi:hypothetical protein
VEDGVLFCQNCGAPQIRVVPPASSPELQVSSPPIWGSTPQVAYPGLPYANESAQIAWSDAWRAALVCGLLEALFSLFGLGVVAGGALCVALYRRRRGETPVTLGIGARLGAISGGFAWLFLTVITSVGVLAFRTGDQIRQLIYDSMQQAASRNPSPQAQELLHYVRSQEGFAMILALILIMTLLFFVVLSSLGGMLGSTLFNKRAR